jgi:hypothetical protein
MVQSLLQLREPLLRGVPASRTVLDDLIVDRTSHQGPLITASFQSEMNPGTTTPIAPFGRYHVNETWISQNDRKSSFLMYQEAT